MSECFLCGTKESTMVCSHRRGGECFLCGTEESTLVCPHCGFISFCQDHQSLHRPENYCYPYKAMYDKELGRHLVASRDISALELIESEYPLMTGPYTKSVPLCLTCYKLVDGSFRCEVCNYPLCGQECATSKEHRGECKLFKQIGFRACVPHMKNVDKQYCCFSVLRLMMLMEENKTEKKLLGFTSSPSRNMLDHCQEDMEENKQMWQFHQEFVVDFIRKILKLEDRFSEAVIYRAMGILQTNAANLEFPDEKYGRATGLYMIYSMLNHSCMCNTKSFKLPDHRMELRAQFDIKAGSQITIQYVKPEQPTFRRRPILRSKWHFSCNCQRCQDPTELGSFLSALLCQRPRCGGAVLPVDSLDDESHWACGTCKVIWPKDRVEKVVEMSEKSVTSSSPQDDIVHHYERVLHNLDKILHPCNFILIDAKQKLGMVLGNYKPYLMDSMARPFKERKLQVCQDVLDTMSKVDQGYTNWRGKLMSEVLRTKLMLVKEDYNRELKEGKPEGRAKHRLDKISLQKRFLIMYLAYYQSVLFGKEKNK